MARQLDIDFSICWGKLEKFQDTVLGSLIINVSLNDFDAVLAYLKKTGIRMEVVE